MNVSLTMKDATVATCSREAEVRQYPRADGEGTISIDFPASTTITIRDWTGSEIEIYVAEDNAAKALELANAFRVAALKHMRAPAPEPAAEVPA